MIKRVFVRNLSMRAAGFAVLLSLRRHGRRMRPRSGLPGFLPLLSFLMLFLVLLAGCSQEETTKARLLCLDLTSYSQASIPECQTQENCFSGVEKAFALGGEHLSPRVNQKLHEYKNHVARSWLYYSRAMKGIREMQEICRSSSDFSATTGKVNELNHNLALAFSEADAANKDSFSIILLERAALENEGVNLIREEKLFSDYAALNNNLNELSLATMQKNSDTYVSLYFERMGEFSQVLGQLNAGPLPLNEFSAMDFVDYLDEPLLAQLPDTVFFMPLLTNAASSIISYFNQALTLQESVAALKKFPSFEVLNTFNGIMGTDNSVAEKFFGLLNSDSSHRAELLQKNAQMESEIQGMIARIDSQISSLDSSNYASFDQNFLNSLYSLLEQQTSIATQAYSLADISTIKEDSTAQCLAIKRSFQSVLDSGFLGKISLGEKTAALKQLRSEALLLSENLDYISAEVVSGLAVLCDERISLIAEKVDSAQFSGGSPTQTSDLRARLKYRISQYKSAAGSTEKLLLCKPAVEQYVLFEKALLNFKEYEIETGSEIEKCLGYLDAVFSSAETALGDYLPVFEKLKLLEEPYENPGQVLNSCLTLRDNAMRIISQDTGVRKITANHAQSKSLLDAITKLADYPNVIAQGTILLAEEQFSAEGQYFSGTSLDAAKALPVLDELEVSSGKMLADFGGILLGAMKTLLERTAAFESFTDSVPELGREYAAKLKLTLQNDFVALGRRIELEIKPPQPNLALSRSSQNVESAIVKDGLLLITLVSVPLGPTVLFFDSNAVLATSEESEKVLWVDSGRAMVERTITLSTSGTLPKLKLATGIPQQELLLWESVHIFSGNSEITFHAEQGSLVFFLDNAENNQKIRLYYTLSNPIAHSFTLLSQEPLDSNTMRYHYSLSITNNLAGVGLNDTKLMLQFPLPENEPEHMEFFASDGKPVQFQALGGGRVAFVAPTIPPKQTMEFYLTLTVKNYESYWLSVAEGYRERLMLLSASASEKTKNLAAGLLGELDSLPAAQTTGSAASINALLALGSRVEELGSAEENLSLSLSNYAVLENEIAGELQRLQSEAETMGLYGFDSFAAPVLGAIADANSHIAKSAGFRLGNDINSAISELFMARAVLSGIPPSGLQQKILEEKDLLMRSAEELFMLSSRYGIQESAARQEIASLENSVSESAMANDFTASRKNLDALGLRITDFNRAISSSLEKRAGEISEKISLFCRLADAEIPALLAELGKLTATDNAAGLASYPLPVTAERLGKIALQLRSLNSLALRKEFDAFLSEVQGGNFLSALGKAEPFEPELDEALAQATLLRDELSGNLNRIKEDAVALFNSAVQKFRGAEPNAEATELLEEARRELEGKNYISSIALSNRATSLVSLPPETGSGIPLAVYPLVAIIAAVLFFSYRKRADMKKKIELRKVMRNE